KVRQAVKHLVRDGRYDYIETGSLVSIRKNIRDIVIPSEEKRLTMHPMDYEEFLWATGDSATMPGLRLLFERRQPMGDRAVRDEMRKFRLYMLVGGMPQAVAAYVEGNNMQEVDEVKRSILDLYAEDFGRIDPSGRLSRLFAAIPAQLSTHASRFQVSSILPGARAAGTLELVSQMESSKAVLVSYHANDPSAGLSGGCSLERYRLFMADTGLFVTQMFRDSGFTDNLIYAKLLSDKLPVNLGCVYENAVAQMLAAKGEALFYHTFKKEEGTGALREIDFLIARRHKICPIEVKSSGYKAHTSLDEFSVKYSSRILERYLVYTRDLRKEGELFCLPVCMVPLL
ncbi:MAG: ATP-binding protein, partial [Duodenibacillus sp.]|nr:ATP-binding protein [Oscillospiraceae bacterium]MCF0254637.1 ATP-binding protein [Duodenibacillus sp.]